MASPDPLYDPLVPTGTLPLDQDYINLQRNFQAADTSFGVDHTNFSTDTEQNGYHKEIRQIPFSTVASNPMNNQPVAAPAAIASYGQIFQAQINDGYNLDEALYFLSGGNRLTQMTRNFQPLAAANGYTSLPGGLVLQWGVVNSNTNGQVFFNNIVTVPSNVKFTSNIFGLWTQLFYNGVTVPTFSGTVAIKLQGGPPATNFLWKVVSSNAGFYDGFFWVALGN